MPPAGRTDVDARHVVQICGDSERPSFEQTRMRHETKREVRQNPHRDIGWRQRS
jgi:hypothetical protein